MNFKSLKIFKVFKREKTKMKMIQEDDLISYLKSLGMYQEILDGEISCKFCKTVITLENLQALFPDNDQISVVCSNIKCISSLHPRKKHD